MKKHQKKHNRQVHKLLGLFIMAFLLLIPIAASADAAIPDDLTGTDYLVIHKTTGDYEDWDNQTSNIQIFTKEGTPINPVSGV